MKYALGALIGIALLAWFFSLCSPASGNKTGHEYMPDMAHPITYEANTLNDYKYNHWNETEDNIFSKAELSRPRYSVEGTVPRGFAGVQYAGAEVLDVVRGKNAPNAVAAPVNPYVPFYYQNTEEDRLRCEIEMKDNPFPITKAGLDRGKELYNIYCGICHGEKGDGQGWLVTMPNSRYLAGPKSFIIDEMVNAGNGRYYFSIMYGKNVMGAYKEKLNYEERWQVIHHIRALQAQNNKTEYSETANTLSNVEKPAQGVASGPARVRIAQ